ncbi:hypothetical protein NPIL_644891 [Nephila pilipes]|uniref:Uncharacterized protein n=1 Tax=Nephila pilipes TaxID=299642 RepID=A0A8X6TF28_NEPPI|nr:hypothetical protein NPIL_644891 [Nephila pilipes]
MFKECIKFLVVDALIHVPHHQRTTTLFYLLTRNERHRQKDSHRCASAEESDDSRFRLLGAVPDSTGSERGEDSPRRTTVAHLQVVFPGQRCPYSEVAAAERLLFQNINQQITFTYSSIKMFLIKFKKFYYSDLRGYI